MSAYIYTSDSCDTFMAHRSTDAFGGGCERRRTRVGLFADPLACISSHFLGFTFRSQGRASFCRSLELELGSTLLSFTSFPLGGVAFFGMANSQLGACQLRDWVGTADTDSGPPSQPKMSNGAPSREIERGNSSKGMWLVLNKKYQISFNKTYNAWPICCLPAKDEPIARCSFDQPVMSPLLAGKGGRSRPFVSCAQTTSTEMTTHAMF